MRTQNGIGLFIGFGSVFLIASSGCAGLKLQMFDHSVHKPSNVAVYFSVETRNGQPVANLTPQDFRIYEDKQPVSVLESKQTILNPEVAAIHYTLLLIDMSGSVVDSGDMPALIQAASTFGDRVGPYQKVAVYTFDGSPHRVIGYASAAQLVRHRPAGQPPLTMYRDGEPVGECRVIDQPQFGESVQYPMGCVVGNASPVQGCRQFGAAVRPPVEHPPHAPVPVQIGQLGKAAAMECDRVPEPVLVAAHGQRRIAAPGHQRGHRRRRHARLVAEHQHQQLAARIDHGQGGGDRR